MSINLALLILVAVLGGIGMARGLVKQVWGVGALVLLILFKPWNLPPLEGILGAMVPGELPGSAALRTLIGFVGLYLSAILAGWLVEKFIIRNTPVVNESDRILGLVFGLAKGLIFAGLMAWSVEALVLKAHTVNEEPPDVLAESTAIRLLGPANPWKVSALRQVLAETSTAADIQALGQAVDEQAPRRGQRLAEMGALDALVATRSETQGDWPRWRDSLFTSSLRQALADPEVSRDLLARIPQ